MIQTVIKAILILAIYYGCIYVFNHYNAWAGIIGAILFTAVLITYYTKRKP